MNANKIFEYVKYTPINYAVFVLIILIFFVCFLFYYNYPIINIGFIFTPILTILFIIIWDSIHSKRQEEIIFKNIEFELLNNIETLKYNSKMILEELKSVNDKKMILNPLRPLNIGILNLLYFKIPDTLLKDDLLSKLAGIYRRFADMNETIKSRENYRVNNSAMSDFHMKLEVYDGSIFLLNVSIILLLEELFDSSELKKDLIGLNELENELINLKAQNNKLKKFWNLDKSEFQ